MMIVCFGASLRKESFNKKLAACANRLLGAEAELLSFNDYPMPVYDGDEETTKGIPDGAKKLIEKISGAQGIIISTPEYNGGISGPLKNAFDWVSRQKPMPWAGKHILLLGASPGALGAVRGLWHTRVPFEAVGAFVYPDMFGLPQANQAFDEAGNIKDPKTQERLKSLVTKFQQHLGR